VKALAPGKRVVHLATHAFFLSGNCESSAPEHGARRGIGGVSYAQGQGVSREEPDPLGLSGLAFAGANHRSEAGPNDEDGILTAEEIAALNLSGVDWAVLSGCDTGLGNIQTGEGVLGLQRAIQIAGAGSVIMSLWEVEDRSAQAWMQALYQARLRQGANTAEAVRRASERVLRDRRAQGLSTHPFYWAAFVATGDWH